MNTATHIIDPNSQRLYWNIYMGLEKEFLKILDVVHLDDNQVSIYSLKIAELLLRTAVEIESISKDLYILAGGDSSKNPIYFDTDCIAFLEQKWGIENRIVFINSPYVYLSKDKMTMRPLRNASKRGKCAWKKAYNAIKHNGRVDIKQGNVENLMFALAALYLLNLCFKGMAGPIEIGGETAIPKFDASFGSSLFSIGVGDAREQVSSKGIKTKHGNFDDSTFLITTNEESAKKFIDGMAAVSVQLNDNLRGQVERVREDPQYEQEFERRKQAELHKLQPQIQTIFNETWHLIKYEAMLNVHQFANRGIAP